ncbi:hypothetical protein EOD41_11750 [Mucilaginibacter limnophilus]|uniref:SMP-30/Gluconolactonase/LRE-like region domain-containing protein n=1 Tax=Mucilaginibacter limnophilus TaxID=1932778 RepID=A0A3S2VMD0_9SPHI|nr:hypothetical protein [Mucilaginibacter limnophilus]RVU00667.1 hypothetical protein EOD41_11750 [Mucilaginibacter limnophilus]
MRTQFYLTIIIIFTLSACKKELSKQPISAEKETEETELLTADVPAAPYTVRTIAGIFEKTSSEPHVVNGPGPKAKFYKPHGISVDGDGSLYIADFFNGLIRKISIYNKVSTVELPPEYYQGGLLPEAAVKDPGGTIYIVSTGYGVRIYNKARGINIVSRIGNADSNLDIEKDSHSVMWFVNDNSLCKIVKREIFRNVVNFSDYLDPNETLRGIGVGPKGVKYVSTASKLFKVTSDGKITRLFPSYRFIFISGIAVTKDGSTLYIADGNAIKKIYQNNITTITGPLGAADGRDGVGINADVVAANLALSNSEKALFVTDTRNIIRKITLP